MSHAERGRPLVQNFYNQPNLGVDISCCHLRRVNVNNPQLAMDAVQRRLGKIRGLQELRSISPIKSNLTYSLTVMCRLKEQSYTRHVTRAQHRSSLTTHSPRVLLLVSLCPSTHWAARAGLGRLWYWGRSTLEISTARGLVRRRNSRMLISASTDF